MYRLAIHCLTNREALKVDKRPKNRHIHRNIAWSTCDLYASDYICSFSNKVIEFASRTLSTERLTGLSVDAKRGIAFIAGCRALERKYRFQI